MWRSSPWRGLDGVLAGLKSRISGIQQTPERQSSTSTRAPARYTIVSQNFVQIGGKMPRAMALLLPCFGLTLFASAAPKHMPLSPALMQAKGIYIDNQTPDCPQCSDQAYDELKKWGRFQVVTDPKDADLLFVLKSTSSERPVSVVSNTNSSSTNSSQTSSSVISVEDYTMFLTVVNAHTNQQLYSNGAYWRFKWSKPTTTLIKELRKRIEDEENEPKK